MGTALEIVHILLPLLLAGGAVVFVVIRMKDKHNKGKLGKKKSKADQNLLDSLIPLGMLTGCAAALILSIIFSIPILSVFGYGAGVGLLLGYVAYEIYSEKRG